MLEDIFIALVYLLSMKYVLSDILLKTQKQVFKRPETAYVCIIDFHSLLFWIDRKVSQEYYKKGNKINSIIFFNEIGILYIYN